jgi:hypothetical protein
MPVLPISLMGLICGKPLGSGSVMCAYLLPKDKAVVARPIEDKFYGNERKNIFRGKDE